MEKLGGGFNLANWRFRVKTANTAYRASAGAVHDTGTSRAYGKTQKPRQYQNRHFAKFKPRQIFPLYGSLQEMIIKDSHEWI